MVGQAVPLPSGLHSKPAAVPNPKVVVGSTTHANSLAMKTEDLFPAMVLQRAPDPGVLHFAALHLISFEVRTLDMPEGIICQGQLLFGSSRSTMVAVLPVLLGQQYDAQALRNWPQSYIASAVGSLTPSSARTLRAQSLDTCRQVALLRRPSSSAPAKPVAISCGTQASLECTCNLGAQLVDKCRQVKQLQDAEAEQRAHLCSHDATISGLKLKLQMSSNSLALSLRQSSKREESLKRDVEQCSQQYLADHQVLQALQIQHRALGQTLIAQAASTQRAEEKAAMLASKLQSTKTELDRAERAARLKCNSELASSYAALSAAKDVLKTDRKALSEAEAAHNVGKRLLEQRVATARCQVQGFMANQAGIKAELSARAHQVSLAGAASLVVMTHAQELQLQCKEQLSSVKERSADLDAIQECQEHETHMHDIKEGELREWSDTLYHLREELEQREASLAAKEKLCLHQLATKESELDAETRSRQQDLLSKETGIKAREDELSKQWAATQAQFAIEQQQWQKTLTEQQRTFQQEVESQRHQLAAHHSFLQQAEAALKIPWQDTSQAR